MALKSLIKGYSSEFDMPMVKVETPLILSGTSGNLVYDIKTIAEEIGAITVDGLVCADIPLGGYGETLYDDDALSDALDELMKENGLS